MPLSSENPSRSYDELVRSIEAEQARLEKAVTAAMKQQGFTETLKSLNKGRLRLPASGMMSVVDGVVEELPCGRYDAALQTDKGRLVLRGAEPTDRESPDPQLIPSKTSQAFDAAIDAGEFATEQLLRQLADAGANPSASLLCTAELASFNPSQHQVLLPLLWKYILEHRNSNERDELIAVGAATRKYIAIMPMDRMGELAILLESGTRSPLAIDLEIEVAKMVYRNFEAHPPVVADPQPELAQRLWEMAQAYINPRILLRDKHSAATSLAIEAIVAMRSAVAKPALLAAVACPYNWFAELVSDDLDDLHTTWSGKNADAASWLDELRNDVFAHA